ncbi:O-methyltransferase [Lacihabitans lacunae]|uniref:O-methyltransferase n=1 Tax=Lacihabitans lacunae TaxID=1028214 RepID=A0ABV7YUE2_9BACT
MEGVDSYCADHSDGEPKALKEVSRDTFANVLKPRMLSGHFQGRLLSLISSLVNPTNILEIGTYTGYSAICMAEGLAENGKLVTIEANEEYEDRILNNFRTAGVSEKIELIIGNALEEIPKLDQKFDLVFIDADKLNYIAYYDMIFEKVNIGGVILSDNVLWDGKVLDNTKKDKTTELLREFNIHLKNDARTQKVLLPIRDGLFVSRKIKEI